MPLIHQCCIVGMRALSSESCALVLADPPYNINVTGGSAWDSKGLEEYMCFSKAWMYEARRILKPGGSILIWGSPNNTMLARLTILATDTLGLEFKQSMCWIYTQGGDGRLQTMSQYATRHEVLLWFTKSGAKHTFNPRPIATPYTEEERAIAVAKGSGRLRTDSLDVGRPPKTWVEMPRVNSRSGERKHGAHPSMKPRELCSRIIRAHSDPADTVVVPFAGSGSEYIQCLLEGRSVIAYELEDKYIDIAKCRAAAHGL